MPEIITQQDLRRVQQLDFCYLCGNPISADQFTRDHVPPKAIFAQEDLNPPLWLPTHESCNGTQSRADEIVGQLISVVHGRFSRPERNRLRMEVAEYEDGEVPSAMFSGLDLGPVIARWVRGFHAVLYGQFLPVCTKNYMHSPFPQGRIDGDRIVIDEHIDQHAHFCEIIKKNRIAHTLDRIVCFNGKCRYECVWYQTDRLRQDMCIFALQIYDWKRLGDKQNFQERGCVGHYMPAGGRPLPATVGTELEFAVQNVARLDPFGN